MSGKLISTGSEWTFELIQEYDKELARLADRFRLDTYPNQIEIISSEQMMDAYASTGMPLMYNHRAIASIQNNRAKQFFQVLVIPACQLPVTFNTAIALIGFDSVQGKAPQNGEVLSPMPGVYLASIL